jgi:hypothetical protein
MSSAFDNTTTEDKIQIASTTFLVSGGLFIIPMAIAPQLYLPENEKSLKFWFSGGAVMEGIGLILSGIAPLTREQLTKREQVDATGRILLGTGLMSIPSLFIFQNVASSRSLVSISAFTLLTIASGSIALGLSQDVGNIMKW